MEIIKEKHFIKLIPSENCYLATKELDNFFEGEIYLSFLDSPDNYTEIDEKIKNEIIDRLTIE